MALITGLFGFSFTIGLVGAVAAQSLDMGARGLAVANAATVAMDYPYESGNPASATSGASLRASFSFGEAYMLNELRYESTALVLPIGSTSVGATIESFGFDSFRRLTASFVGSADFRSSLRLGVRLTVRRVAIPGYGSRSVGGVSAGWVLAVTDDILAGGCWRYIGSPLGYRDRLLPQELSFGFEARASPTLRLLGTIAHEAGSDPDLRIGAEIALVDRFRIRLGTGTNPDRIAGGLGFVAEPATIDVGVSYHRTLGPSILISLALG